MTDGIDKLLVLAVQGVGFPAGPHGQKLGVPLKDILQHAVHHVPRWYAAVFHAFHGLGQSPVAIHRHLHFALHFGGPAMGDLDGLLRGIFKCQAAGFQTNIRNGAEQHYNANHDNRCGNFRSQSQVS